MGGQSHMQQCINTFVMLTVAVPALMFAEYAFNTCIKDTSPVDWHRVGDRTYVLSEEFMCSVTMHHPILTVNIVYFLNVNVLFWLLSFVQGSTWLIDPYWTIIPVMISMFYRFHPLAVFNESRSSYAMALILTWSARLTYSYFRREEWQVGAQEDWRFTEMARKMPKHWWWVKFFAVYISQQPMLVGLTLPLYAVHSTTQPFNTQEEQLIISISLAGIMTAHLADTQLRKFILKNKARKAKGEAPLPILNTGLWKYSRHPNYFGEQMFWLGMGLWAWHLGDKWMIAGTIFNSICMLKVTQLTEARMLAKPERRALYQEYQRTTSMLVPWPKKADAPAPTQQQPEQQQATKAGGNRNAKKQS